MFVFDKIAYFLVSRAKSVVAYLKKFTSPRYVIIYVITYVHIYGRIVQAIDAAQGLIVNLADQFYSWIESAYWGVYNYVRDKLGGIWLSDQIAALVAGIAVSLPFLAFLIFKYVLTPIATLMLVLMLNVLGVVFYLFCRIVIPAVKKAFGGYLFLKWLTPSLRYVNKALDRFARGKLLASLGALVALFAPLAAFGIGETIVSILTDYPCSYATTVPLIGSPYGIPYITPPVYQYTVPSILSWILPSLYGSAYALSIPQTLSYISPNIAQYLQRLLSYSYIYPYASISTLEVTAVMSYIYPALSFAYYPGTITYYYGGYYWYGYYTPYGYYWYGDATLMLSFIYPYLYGLGFYIYPPDTYSYIYTSANFLEATIFDPSIIAGPLYYSLDLLDYSYVMGPYYYSLDLLDYSYIMGPVSFTISIFDNSQIVYESV